MANLNKVFLIGNLTRDPEVRFTPSNMAVSDLRMAVSHTFVGKNNERREETCFVDVVVWGRQAETCGQYLRKGSPALVEGRLQYDEWEKDGQKNSKIRVVADRVQFLGSPRKGEFADQAAERGSSVSREESGQDRGADRAAPADMGPQSGAADAADADNLPF